MMMKQALLFLLFIGSVKGQGKKDSIPTMMKNPNVFESKGMNETWTTEIPARVDTVRLMPGKGTIMYVSPNEDTVYSRIDTANPKAYNFYNHSYRQLKWSDFQGKPCGEFAASSSTTISWSYDMDESGCVTNISAVPEFNPERSWTITSNLYILKHEQGHMDIAKIVCERIFREINPHKKYTEKEWLRLKFDYEEQWVKLDDNYDAKTEHSKNRQAQAKWNSWIAEQLKK